jgi:hypothetical protein
MCSYTTISSDQMCRYTTISSDVVQHNNFFSCAATTISSDVQN